jgi:RND family efflux transporter MFP subunit
MNAKSANMSKVISMRLSAFHGCSLALVCGLLPFLAACSHGNSSGTQTQGPIEVDTAMPRLETFHDHAAAFGQLAADSRNASSLSLPQPGEITDTEVIGGQHVKRGDALLKLETDPTARSTYLQAQSALQVARDDLARTTRLHTEKLATNAQLDVARKALADAQAALAAQAKLGGASEVAILRAPADGVVTALDAQRGQRVAAGAALIRFAPATALQAQLGVDPAAATGIQPGMPVTLEPVYAAPGAPPLHGTVALVGDAVNPQSHLVDLIATLDAHASLPAGIALSAIIATAPIKAWAVPRNALLSDAHGDYVFQIEHGKAKRVEVKVLAPAGSPVGVAGALDPHAPVITLGSYEISSGDPVCAPLSSSGCGKDG